MPFGRIEGALGIDCAWYGRAFVGERMSGDGALGLFENGNIFLAMIDGMGHGREAYAVAVKACEYLRAQWTTDLGSTMEALDAELRDTLGGAVSLCSLDLSKGLFEYAAVGNIVMRIEGADCQKYYAKEGVVGGLNASPRFHSLQLGQGDTMILHTDGVSDRFRIEDIPQLRGFSAGRMARTIVDEFGKSYDDVTCMVLKRSK